MGNIVFNDNHNGIIINFIIERINLVLTSVNVAGLNRSKLKIEAFKGSLERTWLGSRGPLGPRSI